MKRNLPSDRGDRFSGNVRHYHRASAQEQQTWDRWVEGDAAKKRRAKKWLKGFGIALSLLALGGIVVGLYMELK
ncbi:MAG: hypothetical protein ACRDBP_04745 [Luteolibacter sp.]